MDFQIRSIADKLAFISSDMNCLSTTVKQLVTTNRIKGVRVPAQKAAPLIFSQTYLSCIIQQLTSLLYQCNEIAKSKSVNILQDIKRNKSLSTQYAMPPKTLCHMLACDGRIDVDHMAKLIVPKKEWSKTDPNLLFGAINGLIPYIKMKEEAVKDQNDAHIPYQMQCGKWIGNQLEKIKLIVHRGWSLSSKQNGAVAWSQLLKNMNLDQFYVRIICFIHDQMNGATDFINEDGRSLLHFAASIYPANQALKLMSQMVQSGYDVHLRDNVGVTPLMLLRVNLSQTRSKVMMKRYQKIKLAEFELVSQAVSFWYILRMAPSKRYIPDSIRQLITAYVPHSEMIKCRKWEIWDTRGAITKFVYASIARDHWEAMLHQQQTRLQKRKEKENKKEERKLKHIAMTAEERKIMWKKRKMYQKKRKRKKQVKLTKQKRRTKQSNESKKDKKDKKDLNVTASWKENILESLVSSKSKQIYRQRKVEGNEYGSALSRGKRVQFSRRLRIGRYGEDPPQPQIAQQNARPQQKPLAVPQHIAPTQYAVPPVAYREQLALYNSFVMQNERVQPFNYLTKLNGFAVNNDGDNDDNAEEDEKREVEEENDHDSDNDVIGDMATPFQQCLDRLADNLR